MPKNRTLNEHSIAFNEENLKRKKKKSKQQQSSPLVLVALQMEETEKENIRVMKWISTTSCHSNFHEGIIERDTTREGGSFLLLH